MPQWNKVILFGGGTGFGDLNDTWAFTGDDWRQLFPARPPSARESYGMAYDEARGKLVLFGGLLRKSILGDTWVLGSR